MGKNYDTDAELRSIDVWVCKTCGKIWPVKGQQPNWTAADAEKAARRCCSENSICHLCAQRRTRYPHRACDVCTARRHRDRWTNCEVRPLEFPLTTQNDDQWFWDEDSLLDYCEELDEPPESLLLRIGKRVAPRIFEPSEFWCDDTSEDDDPTDAPECRELAKAINEWAHKHIVSYRMGPYRPNLSELEPRTEEGG